MQLKIWINDFYSYGETGEVVPERYNAGVACLGLVVDGATAEAALTKLGKQLDALARVVDEVKPHVPPGPNPF